MGVHAGLGGPVDVFRKCVGRQRDDGDRPGIRPVQGPDRLSRLTAVHLGHLHIHQDCVEKVGLGILEGLQRFPAVFCRGYRRATHLEQLGGNLHVQEVVLSQQDMPSLQLDNRYGLRLLERGGGVADIEEQCARLDAAGITYTLFYLVGMAGRGHGAENAKASAEGVNRIDPYRINVMPLSVFEGTPLYEMVQRGEFEPASERENFLEMRDFVNGLTDCKTFIDTGHDVNLVHFDGVLPRDREGMVKLLSLRAERANERMLSDYRSRMRRF